MNVNFFQQSLNQTLQGLVIYLEQFAEVVVKTSARISGELAHTAELLRCPINFTDLQLTLLKVLLFLLSSTILLIAYSWLVYGKEITDKFVRPSTLKEIEELKLSVAKLKLPKEHSPRI